MTKLLKSRYISTAVAALILSGAAFASDPNQEDTGKTGKPVNPLFANAMALTPDFAKEEAGNLMAILGGLLDINSLTANLPEDPAELEAHLARMQESITSQAQASLARMTQLGEQAAERERLANPDVEKLHQDMMSAVDRDSVQDVIQIIDALKTHLATKEMAVTNIINNAAIKAKDSKNFPLLECILVKTNSEMGNNMYTSSIGAGILARASEAGELECVRTLLNSKVAFNAMDVEGVIYRASAQCHLETIELAMIHFKINRMRTQCFGFKSYYDQAATHKDKELAKRVQQFILLNTDKYCGVGSMDISYYLTKLVAYAQESGETRLLEELLSRPQNDPNLPCPSSYDLDEIFRQNILGPNVVANLNNTPLINLFLNRTANQNRPNEYTVSAVMRAAAQNGCVDFIRSMVDRPATFVRHTEADLVSAFREAQAHNQVAVMDYLRPLIPAQDAPVAVVYAPAANPRYDVGGCLGVHNYAEAPVRIEGSQHASVKLLDAIWDQLSAQCKLLEAQEDYVPLDFEGACADVNDWITTFVPENEQKAARDAAFHRLISDNNYEEVLRKVVQYLNAFHPEGIEVWITAFIRESISAYNSANGVSCDRGIRERVTVGLRNIDGDLDKIFVQVEGPVLMANTVKKWNPAGEPAKVAALLIEAGLSLDAEADDAAALFRELFSGDVKANGLSVDDYQTEMDVISDGIIAYYDDIKAEFKKPAEK
jgi:hypothetical protein